MLQARALYGVTVGNFLPQSQNATGGYTRSATSIATLTGGSFGPLFGESGLGSLPISQYTDSYTANFGIAWELDFWGRFRRSIEAASAELDASVENYDDVLVTLLGNVATNYVQLRILQRQVELLQENARLQREPVKIAQTKVELGRSTELDLSQAKSTLAQTLAQIPQKEIAIRRVNNRLCVLLGISPEQLQTRLAKRSIPETPKEVAVGIPADLLRRRPDVRRAERKAAAECARIGVAEAQLYPHISIVGTLGWQAPKFNQLFTPLAFQGNLGPSFQWDILNYGRIVNNVRFQKAKFQEVVTTYQNKVLTAAEEVENGLIMFLKAQEEVAFLEESVAEAMKAERIGVAEFTAGKVDFIRVSVLQLNLVQQQNLLTQARGDVALGLIQVYRALGGGWQIGTQGCQPSGSFQSSNGLPAVADPSANGVNARFNQPVLGPPTDN